MGIKYGGRLFPKLRLKKDMCARISWAIKKAESLLNRCFWTVVLEKTLESPLDCNEIKPVHPKGDQPWVFIGRTDAKAEAPILWPCDANNQHIGKDLDAGKDWRQKEKGATEDEMVGWHHWLNGHKFEQTGRQGRAGKPGVLQSMVLQRVRHDWETTTSLLGSGKSGTRKEAGTPLKGLFCISLIWQGLLRVTRRNQLSNPVKKSDSFSRFNNYRDKKYKTI